MLNLSVSSKQEVKRKALGLLGIIGLTSDDLAAWKVKQEAKKNHALNRKVQASVGWAARNSLEDSLDKNPPRHLNRAYPGKERPCDRTAIMFPGSDFDRHVMDSRSP
jgi:hypothetical protein